MMTDFLNSQWVVEWMRVAHLAIVEQSQELGRLDRAIGDGDHGENMRRGLDAVVSVLPSDAGDRTPEELFRQVGMDLIGHVGGAAGPLYGSAFLSMARFVHDMRDIHAGDLAGLIRAGCEGIVHRGHAEVGDKTMVDVWDAAVGAAEAARATNASAVEVLGAVARAAQDGAQATEPLVARKGRASYLGERSRGHRDPGAQSSSLIFQAAFAAAEGRQTI